ncbi:MAG: nucleotidyl transferase AbiEii/AbiGii toxin family protein [Mollicutes bacterium]|nr:nucleotidyl transferase AbiEii/AbiGii toxin family protein [Mollicutes bacterium]
MINKDSLKAKANNISKEMNIAQNVVYNRFFYDAFLSRLAVSTYKNKLILKGGLYLSSILGVDTRNTMDIDFYLKKVSMDKELIMRLIEEVSSINIEDGIVFEVVGSTEIREDDIYGGFQVKLLGRLDNVKYQFGIDVATGDPIIPSERNYNYKCLVTGEVLPLKAYSLESVVAEKLETILSRGVTNSRSKDYYDLYILRKTQFDNIDLQVLKEAYKQTCTYRGFYISKTDAIVLLNEIGNNHQIIRRWESYGKNVKYAEGIPFKNVISTIEEWLNICYD